MSTPTARQAYLVASKKKLRSSMRSKLKSMSSMEVEDQSRLVTSHVTSHPAFQRAQNVSCYLSMPFGELDTNNIVSSILKSGKTLFVPRIDHERDEIEMLKISDEHDLSSLPSGTWGIKEPDPFKDGQRRVNATDPESPPLDLILLPGRSLGLAFDRSLSRLGHGKGYYDRFLSSYQAFIAQRSTQGGSDTLDMPVLLGLALNLQLLNTSCDPIPVGDHDWRVDGVIFPDGLVSEVDGGSPNDRPSAS